MSGNVSDAIRSYFETSTHPVLFLGAGVSARAGLPTWAGLLEKLADFLQAHDPLTSQQVREQIRKKNYTKAADFFELAEAPEGERRSALRSLLSNYNANQLVAIAKLPFKTIVTTNFDRSIHDALAIARQSSPQDFKYGDASFREAIWETSLMVARIHGAAEHPGSIILSSSGFTKVIADESYRALLSQCFAQRNVLFVGFSFYDPAIRNVFEELERIHGPAMPGRHVALLPDTAEAEFLAKANRLNIKVVKYPEADRHQALWTGIESFDATAVPHPNSDQDTPFSSTKRYLAACYARSTNSSGQRALKESVLEAVVAAILQEASPKPMSKRDIFEKVRNVVGIKKADSEALVERALLTLRDDGLIRQQKIDKITQFTWQNHAQAQDSLSTDILYLCESLRARAKVQESWTLAAHVSSALPNIFNLLVRTRGWDLGAAFASGRAPDPVEVNALLATPELKLPAYDQERLGRVIMAMIKDPTEKEAKLLLDMGRAAFAIELAFQTPQSFLLHEAVLPQRIYLDASVLLPSIVPGHPFSETYVSALNRLRRAASSAGVDMRLRISTAYLNEVISHRRKAQDFARESGNEMPEIARRDAEYSGAENTNVFVGAYASWIDRHDKHLSFDDFLRRHAPYTTEKALEKYLAQQGYDVVTQHKTSGYPKIYEQLERDYSGALARGKTPLLIEHDALQLAALEEDLGRGYRAILVSADRQLRDFVSRGLNKVLADAMVSHVGLVQFVELMLGGVEESAGFSQLLWSARQSDQQASIRAHYVHQALNAYDAALVMSLPDVVDRLAEQANRDLTRRGQNLDSTDQAARAKAFKALGAHEADFFQKMQTEVEKIMQRLHG